MLDPLFFPALLSPTAAEIAYLCGASLDAADKGSRRLEGLASIEDAGPGDLTFFSSPRLTRAARATRAGACLIRARDRDVLPPSTLALVTPDPGRAFALAAAELAPAALRPASIGGGHNSAGAHIDKSARFEPGVEVDPGAVVGPGVEVGSGTRIGAHAVIGAGVKIGRNCTIGAHASVFHAFVGDRVILHPGVRVGQDGFGFVMGARGHQKIVQVGRVILQDDVEVGANSTIDRGTLGDTVVGEGTKIDNLVQLAHNVVVGRHCVIAAQAGIAGSAELADFVAVGGQAGIAGHLKIGAGARIAGKSGVVRSVPPGARLGGSPAGPVAKFLRAASRVQPRRDNRQD